MERRDPFADYIAIPAINWSTLSYMRRSPLHYRYACDNQRADTARLALGRAAHTAILEPHRFAEDYAVFPGAARRGKAWEAFKEDHGDKTILKIAEYDDAQRMADAVRRNHLAAEYLDRGDAEQPLTWTDVVTSMDCKGRPDWISRSRPTIVDIKTTSDVSANRFGTLAARMGYYIQAAFYRDGHAGHMLRAGFQCELPFVILAVEAAPPHDVAVYELDEDTLWAGQQEYQRLLGIVKECRASGKWPGRFQQQQILQLPGWAVQEDEDDVGGLDLTVNGQALSSQDPELNQELED